MRPRSNCAAVFRERNGKLFRDRESAPRNERPAAAVLPVRAGKGERAHRPAPGRRILLIRPIWNRNAAGTDRGTSAAWPGCWPSRWPRWPGRGMPSRSGIAPCAPRRRTGCCRMREWAQVAAQVMDRTGLAPAGDELGVRWVAVRHAADHVHLVATLARQDGTRPQDLERLLPGAGSLPGRRGTVRAAARLPRRIAPRRGARPGPRRSRRRGAAGPSRRG